MKRLLYALLGCTLIVGAAYAQNPFPGAGQNVNQSLQGSQFGNGPVGLDTSGNLYLPNHLNFLGARVTLTPSAQTCGNSTTNSAATDNVMRVTTGAVTSCQLVFGQVFNNIPACYVSVPGSSVVPTYTIATTGVNITGGLNGVSQNIQAICLGNN